MKTCPRCNSSIEDTCRFCPDCGASQILIAAEPAAPEPAVPQPSVSAELVPPVLAAEPIAPAPGLLRPALVSGLVMGGLSALPVLNACCCLWMVGGGMLASYLYLKQVPPGLGTTATDGAKVGLAAGLIGFVTESVLFVFVQVVMLAGRGRFAARFREQLQEIMARQGEMPPETRRFLDWLSTPSGAAFLVVFVITVFFISFLLLGALGGMLGANILAKREKSASA